MQEQNDRIWSVDILRGLFINFMMIAHAIFFFHTQTSALLQVVNRFFDTVTFTGLLFLSGSAAYFAYIRREHPTHSVVKRLTRRLLIYLIGYYILAILADAIIAHSFDLGHIIGILTFSRLVPFTEFIIAFIIFGFLKIPFRRIYAKLADSLSLTLIVGITVFVFASIAGFIEFPTHLHWFVLLFLGQPNTYSFPILPYLPIYLVGIVVGKWHWDRHHSDTREHYLAKILIGSILLVLPLSLIALVIPSRVTSITRWPPSILFLTIGLIVTLGIQLGIERLHNLYRTPWLRNFLLICGQNAFALFFTHTLVLYAAQAVNFPQVHSGILIAVLWSISVAIALYLAKIIPINYRFELTFVRWCDCELHECTHAREHRYIVALKKLILRTTNLPDLFSLQIGSRRVKPFRLRTFGVVMGLFIITATPLGIAENYFISTNIIQNLSGSTNRRWIIPQLNPELTYQITLPKDVNVSAVKVEYQLDSNPPMPMTQNDHNFSAQIDTTHLILAPHIVHAVVTTPLQEINTQPTQFKVTQPVYVTWTMDWEGYDVPDAYLDALISVSELYHMPMTQLFNPRIYTAPDITKARADYLTQWVKNRRDMNGDEIGLHLHMFLDFVRAAGVTPKTSPAWEDGTGYDILTSDYTTDEMVKILDYAKSLFAEKGLGTPTLYRAGGWFANLDTLKALEQTGFLVDSSARTKYKFGSQQIPGFWDITPTTAPYYPSTFNQNADNPPPQLSILEIPNNGADDYAFSAQQMITRFKDNYAGGIVTAKAQVTYLTHPQWFNPDRQKKMQTVFAAIKPYRYDDDSGPVIPTNLSGVYQAWTSTP